MNSYDDANKMGKEAVDGAMTSFSAITRGFQQIAAETTDFTKRSYEESTRMIEQLSQSKSFEKVVDLQNDFAKSAYQNWVSQATKLSEIYADIAKEAYKPIDSAASAAARGIQPGSMAA